MRYIFLFVCSICVEVAMRPQECKRESTYNTGLGFGNVFILI